MYNKSCNDNISIKIGQDSLTCASEISNLEKIMMIHL